MLTSLAMVTVLLGQAGGWETVTKRDGILLERRAVKDSSFYEFRAKATTDVPVNQACDKIFEWGSVGKDHEGLSVRKLLKDGADERIVYDQQQQPMVSNRDYVMRVKRTREEGACRIHFELTDEAAPPVPSGFVRLGAMKGGWEFETKGEVTQLTYTLYAEPGGSVPAFIVNGAQKDKTIETVKSGLEKVKGK